MRGVGDFGPVCPLRGDMTRRRRRRRSPRPKIVGMSKRQIIVHLPGTMSDDDQAELANSLWAVAVGASSVEVVAPDADAVNKAMDRMWKAAPEFTANGWTRGRKR